MNDRREALRVTRNLSGRDLEKAGLEEGAIALYEDNVADGFDGNLSYDRLAIIYNKRKEYGHEVRVLRAAVARFSKLADTSQRADVRPKLEKFASRLAKAEAQMGKADQQVASSSVLYAPAVTSELIRQYLQ